MVETLRIIKTINISAGNKNRPQYISLIKIFSFINIKNELLAFLGWSYYISEILTLICAIFNFLVFLFSLIKRIYKTCTIHTQVKKQASLPRILFAGFFGIFSTSINKILREAQISKYKKKLSTKPNSYNTPQDKTNTTPKAPSHLPNLHIQPLSSIPQKIRRTLSTVERTENRRTLSGVEVLLQTNTSQRSPISHITRQQPNIDDTYETIVEQPYTKKWFSKQSTF